MIKMCAWLPDLFNDKQPGPDLNWLKCRNIHNILKNNNK